MRKNSFNVVVISLFIFLFAGFSSAQDAPVEITFLQHWTSDVYVELITGAVDAFNASQDDIQVTIETAEGNYEGILERLQLGTVANDLPDVTLMALTYTEFSSENLPVIPVQTFIEAEGYDVSSYFPQLLDLGRASDGELLGMPFLISNPVLFYNADLLEAAGVEVPTTVEEVREAAQVLTDPANDQYGVYFGYTITGNWIFQALVETFGGSMLDAEGRAAFDSDAGRAALQYLYDLANVDQSMPIVDHTQAQQLFTSGKLAMMITSSAAYSIFASSSDFEIGMSEFPTANGNRTIPAGGNSMMIIATGDETREQAAWEFVKFMTSSEINGPLAFGFGYLTVNEAAVEAPEILGDTLAEDARFQVPYNQVTDMVQWYNLGGDIGSRVYSIVQDEIDAVMAGQKSIEQALTDAQNQINSQID